MRVGGSASHVTVEVAQYLPGLGARDANDSRLAAMLFLCRMCDTVVSEYRRRSRGASI